MGGEFGVITPAGQHRGGDVVAPMPGGDGGRRAEARSTGASGVDRCTARLCGAHRGGRAREPEADGTSRRREAQPAPDGQGKAAAGAGGRQTGAPRGLPLVWRCRQRSIGTSASYGGRRISRRSSPSRSLPLKARRSRSSTGREVRDPASSFRPCLAGRAPPPPRPPLRCRSDAARVPRGRRTGRAAAAAHRRRPAGAPPRSPAVPASITLGMRKHRPYRHARRSASPVAVAAERC
jgi:hypothetical protein